MDQNVVLLQLFLDCRVTGAKQCAQGLKEMVWLQSVPSHLGKNFSLLARLVLNRDLLLSTECVLGERHGNVTCNGSKEGKRKKKIIIIITELWSGHKPFTLWALV